MSIPVTKWECSGAYDRDAFATLKPIFDSTAAAAGFLLIWGYKSGRQFTAYHADENTAVTSGYDWVLGCDWFNAPDAVRAMYGTRENYITGNTAEYTCRACGREEQLCSADPCAAVIADRES